MAETVADIYHYLDYHSWLQVAFKQKKAELPSFSHRYIARRLGLTTATDPVAVERDLMDVLPRKEWSDTTMRLIYHGRAVCNSRRPRCEECVMSGFCPSAKVFAPSQASRRLS